MSPLDFICSLELLFRGFRNLDTRSVAWDRCCYFRSLIGHKMLFQWHPIAFLKIFLLLYQICASGSNFRRPESLKLLIDLRGDISKPCLKINTSCLKKWPPQGYRSSEELQNEILAWSLQRRHRQGNKFVDHGCLLVQVSCCA